MGRSSKDIDWEAIERDYRVGVLTIQMLLDKYGVNRVTIHRRAKKYNWTRDLSVQVQAATKAKVNALIVQDATITQQTRNMKDAIEVVSQANINAITIRSHQKDAALIKEIMAELLARLQDQACDADTVKELLERIKAEDPLAYREMYKAMSLSSHVDTLKKITELHATIIKIERQAYNIDTNDKQADPELEAAIKRLRNYPDFPR